MFDRLTDDLLDLSVAERSHGQGMALPAVILCLLCISLCSSCSSCEKEE